MKLEFKLAGAPAALRALKRSGDKKFVLVPDSALLAAPGGLDLLREAADLCIEKGAGLSIEGVTPCLLPGYTRYLSASRRSLPCPAKERCFLQGACAGIPAAHSGVAAAFKPPARPLTDLEKCMLAVLARKNKITTAQVLKLAKGIKICASCSNEGEVFRAAERLIRMGLVAKEYRGGVYIWTKKTG
ncbi:MAG TPA: hypothetical protein DCZ92_14495 [Elusimicrobia bacterium]|nr:MAG: hypothetical protein A2016_09090 [Elusimicrobia bacterium GWF2_62_30]HBA61993.1 hypothetical protein [Elusimicrobiota bacterium]